MTKLTDKECFDALGVPLSASLAEARKAYRRLAMKYHPDRNPSRDAEERFKTISTAFTQLEVGFKNGFASQAASKPSHARAKTEARNERASEPPSRRRQEGWFRFEAQSTTIQELSQAFFAQYAEKGAAAARSGKPFQQEAWEMAREFMALFNHFSIMKAHLHIFSIDFSKEMWRREDPELVAVFIEASNICRSSHSDEVGNAISPGAMLIKPSSLVSTRVFSCLHEISAPRGPGDARAKEKFHSWAAQFFQKNMAHCEIFETMNQDIMLALDGRMFAQRLLENRPELLPIYAKEGWFDWSHESYALRGVNIIEDIAACQSLTWSQIADVFWAGLTPAACAQAVNGLQSLAAAKTIAGHLEDRIIAAGQEEAVLPDRQSLGMSLGRRAKEKMEKTLAELPSGLLDIWRDRSASLGKRSVKALANGKKEALESALADAERQGASLGSLKWNGTSLAALASWMIFFKHPHASTAAATLERIKGSDGGAASMERRDEFGVSPREWSQREAAKRPAEGNPFENGDFWNSGCSDGFASNGSNSFDGDFQNSEDFDEFTHESSRYGNMRKNRFKG